MFMHEPPHSGRLRHAAANSSRLSRRSPRRLARGTRRRFLAAVVVAFAFIG
jgi:hypothetical protein